MAVRRWQVHPDVQVPTHEYGMVPAVSRGLIDQAFLDGAALVSNAGGVFTVVAGRHPTDLPGEMLTTGLVCEWKDRTDAKPAAEQPVQVTVAPEAEEEPEPEYKAKQVDEFDPEKREAVLTDVTPDTPDGFDTSALEDEDLDSVPEHVR